MTLNGVKFKRIRIKRQRNFAVVFFMVLIYFTQSCYALDNNLNNNSSVSNSVTETKKQSTEKVIKDVNEIKLTPNTTSTNSKLKIEVLRPAVSIIIDDIGDRFKDGLRAVSLPAPYTYSFLPNTPFAKRLAEAANGMNKEVMLHMPMQATNGKKLGPNGLTSNMTREVFDKTLMDAFNSIPHISGVNNHMGSLLTSDKQYMNWVMRFVADQKKQLYFIDSRTTADSVIVQAAKDNNINVLSRDTFIDYDATVESVTTQIHYLIKLAKKNGSAIGIAHPYPATLDVLETAWPLFYEAGVDLIPVSELIILEHKRALSEWQLSSSH